MKKVVVGIGIPGSGKTTILKAFAKRNGYAYISPDEIRKAFSGDEKDQSRNKEVWQEAYRKLTVRLGENKSVVFDATFANPVDRKKFLDFAKNSGAENIEGVFFDTPLEIAKERNGKRERVVPAEALEQMHEWLKDHPPEASEGFDEIISSEQFLESEPKEESELQKSSFR